MAKVKGHHNHAYCGGLCVPSFLHEQFEEQLGPHALEMDLLAWYVKRDKERKIECNVIEEPLTWWRDSFIAEIRARGWAQPRKPKPMAAPAPTERMSRITATFGRTAEETQRQLQEMIEYRRRKTIENSNGAIADFKMAQGGDR